MKTQTHMKNGLFFGDFHEDSLMIPCLKESRHK